MAHWRDGGIGNMAGSDDRPLSEWTLLEKLNNLDAFIHKCGETMTTERVIDLAEGMPDLAAWLEGGNVRYMKWVRNRPVYCDKEGVPVERPIRSDPKFGVGNSNKP